MVAATSSTAMAQPARVYAVSATGSASTSTASANSSSLPDILRRRGSSNIRKKRRSALKVDEQLARIELIQDFEFPEASNRITSTRDGQHIVATGTYKPQMRVWECDQLSLKFERHTDAENVDFKLLSDDWTKSIHLQSDRSVQIHAQGGHHARVRIPKFGRALGYHFPSAEGLVGALGNEVYRINLDQGRFMAPFVLGEDEEHGSVTGCDSVDVNAAHGLLSFGTEGAGTVELWDPRARRRAGKLSVKVPAVLDAALFAARRALPGVLDLDGDDEAALTQALRGLSVCALSSKEDGLNLAAGTNTGHTLLYDLRMDKPYAIKDQGFGLPIKSLSWVGDRASVASRAGGAAGTSTTAAQVADSVMSSDAKVIKVWDRNDVASNLVSITPNVGVGDLNHVHHVPGSGLVLAAVEGTRCAAWYVPILGPAPKWCSFLDNLTDELDEEQAMGGKRGIYEDFKFVDKAELERLELGHLVGTNLLRPYMHGYFISLSLWERARLLANPTAYADARERAILAKMEKEAETRIRTTPRDMQRRREAEKLLEGVRVNRELADKIRKAEEREERRRERMEAAAKARAAQAGVEGKEGDAGTAAAAAAADEDKDSEAEEREKETVAKPTNLLRDDRFKELFTNPAFQVDEASREFALLNPSTAARASSSSALGAAGGEGAEKRKRTAVEEMEEASDAESLDPDVEDRRRGEESGEESDSSAEGDLGQFDARHHVNVRRKELEAAARLNRGRGARLVDDDDEDEDDGGEGGEVSFSRAAGNGGKRRSFGERLKNGGGGGRRRDDVGDEEGGMGGKSMSWTPSSSGPGGSKKRFNSDRSDDDSSKAAGPKGRGKKGETFGAGLSKGASSQEGVGTEALSKDQRFGRERRRNVGRSASRNAILRR